jgi:hypothetical protein
MSALRQIRIFLSSPGDVSAERKLARKVIREELQVDPFLRGQVALDVISWDDPAAPAPMLAGLTPQEAVDRGLPKPSECDFVVVILWGRFGSPLPDSQRKPNGERYLSGTEWEYEDAAFAKPPPEILIYRRTEKVLLDADDPQHDSKLEQRKRVNQFFQRFRNPDGSYKGGINTYKTPQSFAERLKSDLRTLLAKRLGETTRPVVISVGRRFERATKAFLDEYLASETGRIPFGGRDRELKRLDAWLSDCGAAPRVLVTAPAGRGKSALLVHWMESLRNRGLVAEGGWQLVFAPVSIRVGTNRPSEFLGGLALRLAEITGQPIPQGAIQDTFTLGDIVRDQLESIASTDRRVLVVIDGADEALEGTFVPTIFPALLPKNLRILVSARWQVGDIDSTGWLRRLEWDDKLQIRVQSFELERLNADGSPMFSSSSVLQGMCWPSNDGSSVGWSN